jgi:hypothetical protein
VREACCLSVNIGSTCVGASQLRKALQELVKSTAGRLRALGRQAQTLFTVIACDSRTAKGKILLKANKDVGLLVHAMTKMAVAQAKASVFDDILSELADTFMQHVGYRLFTLSVLEGDADLTSRRIWSSHPDEYPVSGTKSRPCAEWADQVIGRQEIFLCRDEADVQRVLPDYETIFGLGCGSVLNLPVSLYGSVIGTVNVLHEAHWFTPERVENAETLLALAYAPMLLARCPKLSVEGEML